MCIRDSSPTHSDQSAVDRVRVVGDRPHEEQVAGGPWGEMILEGAEVEHLLVTSDEGGAELAGPRRAPEGRVGPKPGVPATQGHSKALQGRVGTDDTGLMGQLPRVGSEGLDAHIGK